MPRRSFIVSLNFLVSLQIRGGEGGEGKLRKRGDRMSNEDEYVYVRVEATKKVTANADESGLAS